jgi:predicted NBD/HSP70 family sugar kinase
MAPLLGAARIDTRRLIGVGVAIPDDLGRVPLPHWPAGYEAWDRTDVATLLTPTLTLPVFVENDAAAAALGELQFGHGLHHPNFFYILVNLGLGGGLVLDGVYYRGAAGRSGEIGFLPIESGARTLQEAVSLAALYDHLAAAGVAVSQPDQLQTIPAAAMPVLEAWLARSCELLAGPILAINCLINPEAIYIGGRLPVPLIDQLVAQLNVRLQRDSERIPALAPVLRAAMAADAPAVGAAMLPFGDRLLPSRSALMKADG